jgi:hypothetical protein
VIDSGRIRSHLSRHDPAVGRLLEKFLAVAPPADLPSAVVRDRELGACRRAAEKLSSKRRSEIARMAAAARWLPRNTFPIVLDGKEVVDQEETK